jgi:DHA1 family multidrug resistance protein-like MFS transporter
MSESAKRENMFTRSRRIRSVFVTYSKQNDTIYCPFLHYLPRPHSLFDLFVDTMIDLVRDSIFGQLVRFFTRERYLPYPENLPSFTLPEPFDLETTVAAQREAPAQTSNKENESNSSQDVDLEALGTLETSETLQREAGISNWNPSLGHAISLPIPKDRDSRLIVTWYSTKDPDNPQNWSTGKKFWISFLIWCVANPRNIRKPIVNICSSYSFVVYFGSSVYSPGTEQIVNQFGVSPIVASLGLSIYVLACMLYLIQSL